MPELNEFLKGFNLIEGNNFDGYILDKIDASHEAVVRYREYKYPITLTLRGGENKKRRGNNISSLLPSLNDEITKEHIIYGVRNPYRCFIKFQSLTNNGDTVIVKLMGVSYRAN